MDAGQWFVLILAALCLYCTGASWMLQVVCYPTYLLVGSAEFVPFHISFGQRLMVAVIPMVITCLGTFVLVFVRVPTAPLWATLVTAVCGVVILFTTIALEVPKHLKLDKDGKSDELIHGLVRDNLPRTAAWTLASVLLVYLVAVSLV
ncbi:MAG: hypothetical protein ACOYL5_06620 [Phototrophicaceae bacterium]|jgi:hypothetical protein